MQQRVPLVIGDIMFQTWEQEVQAQTEEEVMNDPNFNIFLRLMLAEKKASMNAMTRGRVIGNPNFYLSSSPNLSAPRLWPARCRETK